MVAGQGLSCNFCDELHINPKVEFPKIGLFDCVGHPGIAKEDFSVLP